MPITEPVVSIMAKDSKVTFDSSTAQMPSNKPSNKPRHGRVSRQISFEDAENCVNEMSESFPAFSRGAHRLIRQVSGSFNNRTVKVALILSVILNLLLGIPFGIFFGFWMSQRVTLVAAPSTSPASSSSYISCRPCADRDLSLDLRLKGGNSKFCCTDDKVFEMEGSSYFCLAADAFKKHCVGNSDMARPPPPCTSSPGATSVGTSDADMAAAHLMLDVELTKSRIKDTRHKNEMPLVWVYKDAEHMTFVGGGVEYFNGQIKIHKSGKYHIYSHMTLSTNENPLSEQEAEKIVVHSLLWNTRGAAKPLLFSQVTLKPNEVKSTDIEGSFQLLEGDVISVYLSHPSFIKNVSPANVFGLFIL